MSSTSERSLPAPTTPTPTITDGDAIILYPSRYFQLALFSFLSFSNAFQWIAFAAKSETFRTYLDLPSSLEVNILSLVYLIAYPPLLPAALWLFRDDVTWGGLWGWVWKRKDSHSGGENLRDDAESSMLRGESGNRDRTKQKSIAGRGLHRGIVFGAALNAIGSVLRWIAVGSGISPSYALLLTGQTLAAFGQVFILGVPPLLASSWFGASERNTASAIGISANNLGIAACFLASMLIDDGRPGETIPPFMLSQAIGCVAVFLLIVFFFRGRPPTPPSLSSAREIEIHKRFDNSLDDDSFIEDEEQDEHRKFHSLTFGEQLKMLMKTPTFLFFVISYGLNCAGTFSFATVVDQILRPPFPEHADEVGLLGFLVVIGGIVGSMIVGYVLDRTHQFRSTYVLLYFGTVFFALAMHLILYFAPLVETTYRIYFAMIWVHYGIAVIPVSFQYASELFYPHSDAMITNILNASSNLFGGILIVVMSLLELPAETVGDPPTPQPFYAMRNAVTVWVVTALIAALLALRVRGRLVRQEYDRRL